MITKEQLQAERDQILEAQMAEVEADIDKALRENNLEGERSYYYDTASITAAQARWLVERYQATGFDMRLETLEEELPVTFRITFHW